MEIQEIKVSLPKFKLDSKNSLKEILTKLGLKNYVYRFG